MKFLSLFVLTLFSIACFSATPTKIEFDNPYVHLPPPGATVTALFVKIMNHTEKDVHLIEVKGDIAETFELHSMQTIDGKMKMRRVPSIQIPKNKSVELMPGSFHVMIFGLKKTLNNGQISHFTLIFDNGEKLDLAAKIEKRD